jgi:hypothetical protein
MSNFFCVFCLIFCVEACVADEDGLIFEPDHPDIPEDIFSNDYQTNQSLPVKFKFLFFNFSHQKKEYYTSNSNTHQKRYELTKFQSFMCRLERI